MFAKISLDSSTSFLERSITTFEVRIVSSRVVSLASASVSSVRGVLTGLNFLTAIALPNLDANLTRRFARTAIFAK